MRENYDCDTGGILRVFQLAPEQNTARDIYLKILADTQATKTERNIDRGIEDLWFTDIETLKIRQYRNLFKINPNKKIISDFLELLEAANKFLFLAKPLPEESDPADITRILIICAYYYYFTTKYRFDNFSQGHEN